MDAKFRKQVAKARSKTFQKNRAWKGVDVYLGNYNNADDVAKLFNNRFDDNVKTAYERESGVQISRNPLTGKKEMYVAGSRSFDDWINNFNNGIFYNIPLLGKYMNWTDPHRNEYQDYISQMAKDNDVDVVLGHSRGGAYVADMDYKGTKVGLDAAMSLARNKDMLNVTDERFFDALIGMGGKRNVKKKSNKIHFVWK